MRAAATINYTTSHSVWDKRTNGRQQANGRVHGDEACSYCGNAKHGDGTECPAKSSTCHKCGKPNHFSRVCRSNLYSSIKLKLSQKQSRFGLYDYIFESVQSGDCGSRVPMFDDQICKIIFPNCAVLDKLLLKAVFVASQIVEFVRQ
jgi:hypothetical protein